MIAVLVVALFAAVLDSWQDAVAVVAAATVCVVVVTSNQQMKAKVGGVEVSIGANGKPMHDRLTVALEAIARIEARQRAFEERLGGLEDAFTDPKEAA